MTDSPLAGTHTHFRLWVLAAERRFSPEDSTDNNLHPPNDFTNLKRHDYIKDISRTFVWHQHLAACNLET